MSSTLAVAEFSSPAPRFSADRRLTELLAHAWIAWQPLVDGWTGKVVAREALLRSALPGSRGPMEMLELGEELGRLHEVEAKVRSLVAGEIPLLEGDADAYVNISPAELCNGILGTAADPLLPFAHRVVLEVTEGSELPDEALVQHALMRARAAGYRIAVDDVGTGADLLPRLLALCPDVYKIDRMALDGCTKDARKRHFINLVVQMARADGALVIAEGIERACDWHTARELGCDVMQGYYFARPAPLVQPTPDVAG